MNAHARVNKLVAVAHRLGKPLSPGQWEIVHGQRFEAVSTPGGLVWRTQAELDFGSKKP